ncbi:MAG: endo alpha-1,4 polygalactosaminidase [Eubacterium sp.]|nr:endo alpha-1,4 polygalactosaminidase [Eubacterium sp.]
MSNIIGIIKKEIAFASLFIILMASACGNVNESSNDNLNENDESNIVSSDIDDNTANITDQDNQDIDDNTNTAEQNASDNDYYSTLNYNCKYGVFLSFEGDLDLLSDYDLVVIDGQYFSKEEIENFKNKGHIVFSYINIGSIETFRSYYSEYENLTLDDYENWEEEKWVDASSEKWQNFVINTLAQELLDKGIDGFFVDNCDVYYHYPNDEMLDGVSTIMKYLVSTGKFVSINGGDVFLDAYCEKKGEWSDVITGINQETVYSKINWENDTFSENSDKDRKYYSDYIEKYSSLGAYIFLLEYTRSEDVKKDIDAYCQKHNYLFYISDSIELD